MKRIAFILLLLMTTSVFGHFFMPLQKPMLGLQLNRAHPLSRGLAGCWLFNEGSGNKVFDLSGNGNVGVLEDATWDAGRIKCAANTDDVTFGPSHFGITNNMTVVLYKVTVDSFIAGKYIFSRSGYHRPFSIRLALSNTIQIHLLTDGNDVSLNAQNGSLPAGATADIAFTWDGVVAQVYIDGSLNNTDTPVAPGANLSWVGDEESWQIGETKRGSAGDGFIGKINHVMIFNRALTASEIALLYREPFCMFKPSWDWTFYAALSIVSAGHQVIIPTFYGF